MENLSINEGSSYGGGSQTANHALQGPPPAQSLGQAPQPHGGPAQLPPQMFTTAAQLLDLTDKKLVLVLRDGRKLIGVLRSWDQFANLVLTESVERIFVKDVYADIPRGIYLVRGENVLLLGEVDLDKDEYISEPFRQVSEQQINKLLKTDKVGQKARERNREKALKKLGFEIDHGGEALY